MTGREYEESQKIRAETTYRITIRHMAGLATDMRVLFGDRKFEIVSILNLEEHNLEIQMMASEVDEHGKG